MVSWVTADMPREQRAVVVRHLRLDADGARLRIDPRIDRCHARLELLAGGHESGDRLADGDVGDVALGKAEDQLERTGLGELDDRIAGLDERPEAHLAKTEDAAKGGADLHLLEPRLRGLELARARLARRTGVVDLLLGGDGGAAERLHALEDLAGVAGTGAADGDLGPGLGVVDLHQQVPGLHLAAFGDVEGGDLPRDLGRDLGALRAPQLADRLERAIERA
jgi:hypothetical protein